MTLKMTTGRLLVAGMGLLGRVNPYRNAWLLMDRPQQANDNAEALLRYLRRAQPRTRVYFALRSDSPDWARLTNDGYGESLVAHGGLRWRLVLASARVQASSHPISRRHGNRPDCILVYLRHGITVSDHSRFINSFSHDLMLSGTLAEHRFISAASGPYRGARRIRLTGLPRFDRLHELVQGADIRPKDMLVVAPTWRQWAFGPSAESLPNGSATSVREYLDEWRGVLGALLGRAERHGLRLVLLPHPLAEAAFHTVELPTQLQVVNYSRDDVQSMLARTALLVTDYSSVAFDAAYAGAAVLYYQYDRDRFFGGDHHVAAGYWDVETMGFGPVVADLGTLESEVDSWLQAGMGVHRAYGERVRAAFPRRDGQCCERVVAEISSLLTAGLPRQPTQSDGSRCDRRTTRPNSRSHPDRPSCA